MTSTGPDYPSFFLVGTGRSGTTLARTMLSGHSAVAIPGETGFLPRLLRLRRLWWSDDGLRTDLFLRLVFANGRLRRAGLSVEELRAALVDDPPADHRAAIGAIYACFARRDGAQVVGDKTPVYLDHMSLLAREFPDARWIHIVRHPLDVVASLRRQPWGPSSTLAAAWSWRLGQERAARAALPSSRHLEIRLEDLVQRPEDVLRRVSDHLGLEYEPSMLAYDDRAERIIAENIHPTSHAGLRSGLSSTARWSDDLSDREAQEAWAVVAPVAARYGYEGPVGDDARGGLAWRARAQLATHNVGRSWRRVRTLRRFVST